ncbi:EPIDERMAL PATTERNING FACTOR-like protein 5 isoform X1 [Dioscorea cayenensis subsp. rotundata]|uniref:Epidermal patterning factor-like protein n=1 Tax=Dioscorea cayennensis subsp. rotundata TaxID=55577 RepID=A0AB40D262_DIOCR|nr:EPIDERMAL PATTERNING FACTOR-like protein 5 isoform X1 [Dioscorea cayenensis subsp. rotundata]
MELRRVFVSKLVFSCCVSLFLLFTWVLAVHGCSNWSAYLDFRSWREALNAQQDGAAPRMPLMMGTRRQLGEVPGSYPPRCKSKCGNCTPCNPVHVPVPPGIPVIAEYYPEAWRCKCGNKLYMP